MSQGLEKVGSYQDVGVFEIVFPVGANLALPADVPHVQFEAVGDDRLDVESCCGGHVVDVLGC